MPRPLLIVVCLLLLLAGCERQKEAPAERPAPPAPPAVPLFSAPVEATLVEYATHALPTWRRCRGAGPALVLFAGEPLLQPVPDPLREEVRTLLRDAGDEEILARTATDRPDPLLMPSMALEAALDAGLFAEVLWVLPSSAAVDELQLELFRKQLLDFGAVDEAEAQSFALEGGVFAGTVRGVPFRAVHPDALPAVERPIVLHIDQNFFQPFYKGEIKTPLYPLLYETLRRVREANWRVCAATIARSNLTGELPLDSRFIGAELASLLAAPEQLDQPLPIFRQQRANALYLPNFFQNEKIRDIYLEMEAAAPEDASVKYGLYRIYRDLKEGTAALDYLAQAVTRDPAYALEYLDLAPTAREKNRPDQALRMLQLASDALPDNPFIALDLAAFLIEVRHGDEALEILERLGELTWSPVYYPDMARQIEAMKNAAGEARQQAGP